MTKEEENLADIQSFELKISLAEMLTGGVIIDVSSPDEAKIAEEAGATAVTVSDTPCENTCVSRMSHPETIKKIQEVITIPIIAKCRIGHFAEAQILESLFVDFIDENESLTIADERHYIDKHQFRIPFICGCRDLGQALRRIAEGVSLLRTEGSPGNNPLASAVKQLRDIRAGLRNVASMDHAELLAEATRINAPYDFLEEIAHVGKLPIPLCAAGGIVTPADASLMIQLGAETVFIDREIFKSANPKKWIRAIVNAVTYHRDPEMLTKASLGDVTEMNSESSEEGKEEFFTNRGWGM